MVPPPAKNKRLSAKECRERLVEVGLQSLAETGLTVGLDAVNLEQAVRDANVPRSSAYVAWSNDSERSPGQAFQRAVLMEAVANRVETIDAVIEQVGDMLADPPDGLSGRDLFREVTRLGGKFNIENALMSQDWRIVFALRSIMHTGAPERGDPELLAWVSKSEQEIRHDTIERFYKPTAQIFGIRPRPQFGDRAWHLIEVAHSALIEGLSMRSSLDAGRYFDDLIHHDVPDGESNWSIYALLFDRFVDTFFVFEDAKVAAATP